MANRQNRGDDDWAEQVPWERPHLPYRAYGWEANEFALPEFRDPSIHLMPEDIEELRREARENEWRIRGPFTGVGPRNYSRSDEHILSDVVDRLTVHGQVDARNIEVDVENGEVTISGEIADRWMKRMAEDAAWSVPGVWDVHNRLRIQPRAQEDYEELQQAKQSTKGRGRTRKTQSKSSGRTSSGRGRKETVKGSGVYPASGPLPDEDAEAQGMASWGQGERGAEGYQDHGSSELPMEGERKGKTEGKGEGRGNK